MKNLKEQLQNSKMKYGGYAAVITFVITVGVIVVNLVIQQLGWQLDLTDNRVYTLSRQTQDILRELEEDVTLYYLSARNQENDQIIEALDLYAQASNRVTIETVDPETNPAFAAQYDPQGQGLRNGSVIVATDDQFRTIQAVDLFSVDRRNPQAPQILGLNVERRVTNALIFVGTGRTPVVYQTTGHGELNLTTGGALLRRLGEQFESANFDLRSIDLGQSPQVPADASILAIVRPRTDISPVEAEKIAAFLGNGGKAFLALEFSDEPFPNLGSVLERYGLGTPVAVVLEPNRNFNNGQPVELWPSLEETSITRPLIEADYRVFTPLARPITVLQTRPRSVEITPLLVTSDESFYRTDLTNQSLNRGPSDTRGPVSIAVQAIEREFTTGDEISRIVVVGDSDFVSLVDQVNGNLDFLLNSFGWLEDQEDTLSIRPATTLQFPMNLTGMQQLIFGGIFVVIIPLAILIAGLVIWLRRRHL
jgi:ABC-2 type transport system permease protein